MSVLTLLFHTVLEILASAIRQEEEIKEKPSLFTDMISSSQKTLRNQPPMTTKKLLELVSLIN